jgi:hypothetical protein
LRRSVLIVLIVRSGLVPLKPSVASSQRRFVK